MRMAMYRFNDFLLDPATRELHERGELVALPARAFDCLAYLVEHRDRAVGRDELIAAVWGRVEVSEALLSHTIVKLRRSLGDTGSEQRLIRTVPRFGYRWTGAITLVESPAVGSVPFKSALVEPAPAAPAGDAPIERAPTATASAGAMAAPEPRRRKLRALAGAGALVALAVLLALASWWRPSAHDAPTADAVPPRANVALAAPALVLPAEIDAPEDWRWLRLGLMDLVATRLRAGALPTMSSESVVALLRTRDPAAPDALHDATLAQVAALRVQPRVRLADAGWEVRLDAFGAQRELDVTARHADAVMAAREAADRLLHELGRAPGSGAQVGSIELEHLLQHAGAAMLADQLDEARALIDAAPAALRQAPRAQQRIAQIDLRRGDYPAVEQRLHALLDGLDPARDGALRARVLITLAAALVRQDQPARAGELYEEAIALRRDAGDHEALGVALLGRGVVLAQAGRIDEALGELARARIELETVGDSLGVASVDVNVGDFQLMRHRPADALAMLVEAADAFARLGAREGLAHALAQQVAAQLERVDPAAALAASERAWPPESHTSNLRMRWVLVLARAEALAASGQASAARELLAQVRDTADPRRDAGVRAGAQALAARLAWAQGDAAAAREAAAAALLPALQAAAPIAHLRTRLVHLRALRAAGEGARAAEEVRSLRDSAGTDEWLTMQADLAEGEQAWSEGRREPALERFERAWQNAGRVGTARDLVDIAAVYVAPLIEASQLDTARAVGGRIARWVDVDWHAADAMAKLYRAIGEHAAAHKAEQAMARLAPD
ncbi:MAG: tetratricopeptide repeat protein [Lysobacteraceae bacterium]|nr:MAG: tetratricopeptide repeat protein [Xanthomonadaceae bacterium]